MRGDISCHYRKKYLFLRVAIGKELIKIILLFNALHERLHCLFCSEKFFLCNDVTIPVKHLIANSKIHGLLLLLIEVL